MIDHISLFEPLVVSPDLILLDSSNYRLLGDKNAPHPSCMTSLCDLETQELLRRYLIKSHQVMCLIDTISRIGFLPVDHIVIKKFNDRYFVVVEGNRRLAAIKTLLGNVKRKAITLPPSIVNSLEKIKVLLIDCIKSYNSYDHLLIQGIRHISGIQKWGPYQQALLIHTIINNSNVSRKEAAMTVGLSPSRINSLLYGFYGLSQFLNDNVFNGLSGPEYFSHFEQAYSKIQVRAWLSWCDKSNTYTNSKNLIFFYKSITSQQHECTHALFARDIRDRLPQVLDHPAAREAFLSGEVTIHAAFAMTQPQNTQLRSLLDSATSLIRQMKHDPSPVSLSAKDRKTLAKLHALTGNLLQQQNQAE